MDEKRKRLLAERRRRERIRKKKQNLMTIMICLVVIVVEIALIVMIKPKNSETKLPEISNPPTETSNEESDVLSFDDILKSIKIKDSACLLGGSLLPTQFVAGYDEFDISVSFSEGAPITSESGEYSIGITVKDNKSQRKAQYNVNYTVYNIKSYHHVPIGSDPIRYSDIVLDNSINAVMDIDPATIDCSKSGTHFINIRISGLKYECKIEVS